VLDPVYIDTRHPPPTTLIESISHVYSIFRNAVAASLDQAELPIIVKLQKTHLGEKQTIISTIERVSYALRFEVT
jgi:hypothetical protein